MPSQATAAVVLAAGLGTRMKSAKPKVLHEVGGLPLVMHLLKTVERVGIDRTVVVIGPGMDEAVELVAPRPTAVQTERLGTGHAVLQAKDALKDFKGDVLVAYGDTPFVTERSFQKMLAARQGANPPAVVVLGFTPDDPGSYGRLIVGPNGLERIVEAKDATPEQRQVKLCNSGILLMDGAHAWDLLAKIDRNNAKGEYYLTDVVGHARKAGLTCAVVDGEEAELLGINSRVELATAEKLFQDRMRRAALEGGATMTDPNTVYFSHDTKVGREVTIGPFVVFGLGVTVEDDVEIKGFCHFEKAKISAGAIVGPYARLRPGAVVGTDAHVGNFVEVKNSTLEPGAKVNHLTYIGDARVGKNANVGAGTITANYDGFNKSFTDIGAGASIGSNAVLVAPVKIGDGAMVGAGTVVRKDVPNDALAVSGGRQETLDGFAAKYRVKKKAEKEAKRKT